jgi:ABC-2 type transport system ATP-binding protein
VLRPTLDDVFLTLTGRSLRDAEAEAEVEADTGSDRSPVAKPPSPSWREPTDDDVRA